MVEERPPQADASRNRRPAPPHRVGELHLRLVDPEGAPLAEREVVVEQTRHAFAFGSTGFELIPHANGEADAAALAEHWLGVFDTATLPFYRGDFEPEPGVTQTDRIRAAARWFADRDVRLKGHPLVWHTVKAPWMDALSLDEGWRVTLERVRREVGAFRGLVDTWDVVNEAVIMPVFENEPDGVPNVISRIARAKGRIPLIREAFDAARETNPGATLLINDFDLSSAYECLIEGLLENGVRIDAIGLQTHMHQGYWGEETMLAMVDRFARYGLPLHLTENTLLSGELMPAHIVDLNDYQPDSWPSTPEGEARQADELVRHYRSLVGHPSVQSITYWGITDAGAWLGAPAGLLRADGSRKPAYDALRELVRGEWWLPPTRIRTDDDGVVRVSGFLGDYRVTLGDRTAAFSIERSGTDAALDPLVLA
ncbi:endo-1,4-beta-xylanase [Protaetiibacter sp. SSC-01]|uniref:endo-1,4-beta-xylanase n=1 Tax=Protaetiibacter sp. SSC-01 TaxID=2759943 RepID=UPI0016575792|nr:endo-1,4-beta-xylanase [Protaetiibacter sp. SSC-01]QNO37160.1 endo-1,4-beta-xylanase [Protaetiibacter sp. SSC-01]